MSSSKVEPFRRTATAAQDAEARMRAQNALASAASTATAKAPHVQDGGVGSVWLCGLTFAAMLCVDDSWQTLTVEHEAKVDGDARGTMVRFEVDYGRGPSGERATWSSNWSPYERLEDFARALGDMPWMTARGSRRPVAQALSAWRRALGPGKKSWTLQHQAEDFLDFVEKAELREPQRSEPPPAESIERLGAALEELSRE